MPKGDLPNCFDPYLRYAISTDFKNFEFFDEMKKLFFLVEFKEAKLAAAFEKAMGGRKFGIEFGPVPVDHNTLYATLRTRKAAVLDPRIFPIWEKYVSRVELSLPLEQTPQRALKKRRRILVDRWQLGKPSPGSLLIGLLDDGCPFAAARFLNTSTSAAASTRVRGIWDQNQGKQPVKVNDSAGLPCRFGQPLSDFAYGLEFLRNSDTPGPPLRQIELDEWTQLHAMPTGSIDEDGCYADAGFASLAPRDSHGAHVMDVFAGRFPTSSRVGPSHDRRDPPSWKAGTDPACSADLVFVQFPEAGIRNSTGVWLKAYVLDGIRYILSFANPQKTKQVVINLSYGPTTGPHDGTAELEAALTALVAEYNGTTRKPKLEIVLAAGNAYLSEGHVVFVRDTTQPDHVEWTWRLPPDNTVLCFSEIWMKYADAAGVTVTLTSPSGVTITSTTSANPPPSTASVGGPFAWGNDKMWRLEVGPTVAAPGDVAEHGDWTIKVTGIGINAPVNAYVARSDPNMGVRSGAKLSYFVDPKWERTRSAQASCTRVDGEFDQTGSLIHRDGTLNGIATANDTSVHVAGGYIIADGRKAPYSSAGPTRSVPLPLRVGPDVVLPCDKSYALEGIRAGSNRSGSVFRLIGTSTAAPQLARRVVNPPIPPAHDVPTSPPEIGKRGGGDVDPP